MGSGEYGLDDLISFGKYGPKSELNLTIAQIIIRDPEYLEWCELNVGGFKLSSEAALELDLAIDWEEELGRWIEW